MPTPNLAASSVFALAQQVSAAPAARPDACAHGVRLPHECDVCADTPSAAEISAFMHEQAKSSTKPKPSPAEGFRCALFNDGTLFIRSNGAEHTLPTEHTRALLRYLDALKPGEIDA